MPKSSWEDWEEIYDDFTGRRLWRNKITGKETICKPSFCGNCNENIDDCTCTGSGLTYESDTSGWGRPGGGFQGGF